MVFPLLKSSVRSLLWCALLPLGALASQVVKRSLAERAVLADRVVLAQVLSTRTVAEGGDPRRLVTLTEVVVGESLKGQGPERLTVVQRGGTLGRWQAVVPGDARFFAQETALLLLKCGAPDTCVLVTLGEGKVAIKGADALLFDLSSGQYRRRPAAEVLAEVRAAVASAPRSPGPMIPAAGARAAAPVAPTPAVGPAALPIPPAPTAPGPETAR